MAPDTAAVDAFMAARKADAGGYQGGDVLAFWAAVKAHRWDPLTMAAVRGALGRWHAAGEPGRVSEEGGGPLEDAAPGGGGAAVVVRGDHLPAVAAEGAGGLAEVGQGHRFLPVLPVAARESVGAAQTAGGAGGIVHTGPVYRTQQGGQS
jgi:hypothetical protein